MRTLENVLDGLRRQIGNNMQSSLPDQAGHFGIGQVRAAYGLLVLLLWAVFAAVWRQSLIGDPDIWWHITTGSWIWQHGAFPTTDPFSHSFAGAPWIAKEWLSQLLFYAGFTAAGWNGIMLVTAAAMALAAGALYWALSQYLSPLYAAAASTLGMALAGPALTARPHLLTLALAVIWTHQLLSASWKGRAPHLGLLILLVVWANLHAAFTLGIVIAAFAFLDFVERNRMARPGELVKWLVFIVLCPLVSLIHPYGWQAILSTWTVAGSNETVALIQEWQPFSAQDGVMQEAAMLIFIFVALTNGFRLGLARTLLLLFLLHMFLTHVRFVFLFFTLLPVIVAPEIARQFPRLSLDTWRMQRRDALESRLIASFRPLAVLLVAGLAVVAFLQALVLSTQPPAKVALSGALSFVKTRGISGNVFNHYNFGGPLIFNGIPTFIDGRTDRLFLGGFANTFMSGPATDWQLTEALRKYKIGWTLLPPGDARVASLNRMRGWQRVYSDKYAVIHVPRGTTLR